MQAQSIFSGLSSVVYLDFEDQCTRDDLVELADQMWNFIKSAKELDSNETAFDAGEFVLAITRKEKLDG